MNTAKTAAALLGEMEMKLRELVAQAAASGEYDVAVKMAAAAKSVAAIAHAFNQPGSGQEAAFPTFADSAGAGTTDSLSHATSPSGRREISKPAGRSSRAPKRGVYPRFFRERDCLVKVSWSKKERGEYMHKAPHRVAELLAAAISRRAANGRLFTTDDVFPLKDSQNGSDVPSYQAYAALAWFKAAGLVRPHGRRGYTVKKDARLSELMTAAWQNLSESAHEQRSM